MPQESQRSHPKATGLLCLHSAKVKAGHSQLNRSRVRRCSCIIFEKGKEFLPEIYDLMIWKKDYLPLLSLICLESSQEHLLPVTWVLCECTVIIGKKRRCNEVPLQFIELVRSSASSDTV